MRPLSPTGQQAVNDLAQRYSFSQDAVLAMLEAVIAGHGGMAQFNHPEFGGSGQWMRGGMIMLSDMFNNYLKGRVDGLCNDLAVLVTNQPDWIGGGSFQSQNQGGGFGQQQQGGYSSQQQQNGLGPTGPASLFVPPAQGTAGNWWGTDLNWPTSTGSQNNVRYAYFAQARRLAIDVGGQVTIYDTLDHQIGGFSQQQSVGGSLTFTSQYGLVEVTRLPIISVDGAAPPPTVSPAGSASPIPATPPSGGEGDVFALIERLAALHAKGILSAEEFATKKTELLSRL